VFVNNDTAKTYNLELVEDYGSIAFKTLKDRTVREISKVALRVAAKKVSESIARNQNQSLGVVFSIFNALTEKTDTRNWQTLPNKIFYSRIPLPKMDNTIKIKVQSNTGTNQVQEFKVRAAKKIQFLNYITPQIIVDTN